MAERKKLTTRRSSAAGRPDVEKAVKAITEVDQPKKRVPYDTSVDIHRKLSSMRVNSADNVPVKTFLDEAVEDLFEKYRRGEGRYQVKDIERILGD
ncbi:hypothetical protein K4A83_11285 [Spirulina subsalsa FACHB-351]|uniref:Uncharacterized protein n=1 Tax=Spirulina subsalsa FACHB-351 TaxID=234711 RepID=A0ABT3L5Q1_9CYAN|nr:hypothetical protein [Spirulina subsalsa]MCW6036841.1 hypothetical protein [Spirulina subsalsa FACHB-351]